MKVGKFNILTKSEYITVIDNNKKYSDFNPLALYRSILENDKLNIVDKIEIREYANKYFEKFYNFLQIKDIDTYFDLFILGMDLDKPQKNQILRDIVKNQEKILKDKRIKHRNFGTYSRHMCGIESCPMNGLMTQQNSFIREDAMCFNTDKKSMFNKYDSKYYQKKQNKIERRKPLTDFEI